MVAKSKTQWWLNRENNTRYFHSKTISWRRKSHVYHMKNTEGEWTNDRRNLKIWLDLFLRSCVYLNRCNSMIQTSLNSHNSLRGNCNFE